MYSSLIEWKEICFFFYVEDQLISRLICLNWYSSEDVPDWNDKSVLTAENLISLHASDVNEFGEFHTNGTVSWLFLRVIMG